MTSTDYIIEIRGDVLYCKLFGRWDLSTDMKYSMDYATVAQHMRNRPWAILCDMSEWSLSIKNPESKSIITSFDRRNQVAECWVIKNEKQVSSLKPFLESHPHIKLSWFTEAKDADNWMQQQSLSYTNSIK